MNALELADAVEPLVLTSFHETQYIGRKAADMLRKQHEAIKQLRDALASCTKIFPPMYYAHHDAENALKKTEEIAK